MPAYLPSQFIFKAFDNNGLPLSGGQLFTYQSGTSIPLATYTDATGLTQTSNPIILDTYGQATIWLSSNLYRFNLLDINSVQMPDYPIDNVSSASGSSGGGSSSGNTAITSQTIVATSGQTVFNLSSAYLQGINTLSVYQNGSRLILNLDYTETTTTSITLAIGATLGDDLTFIIISNINTLITAGTNISYTPSGTGAVSTNVTAKLQQTISVLDFGADPTGVSDSTAAFASAYAASLWNEIPPGTYKVSALPNYGTYGTRIIGLGNVIINYTGSGQCLVIDAGVSSGTVNNVGIENIIFNGTSSATDGIFLRGLCRSYLRNVRVKNFPTSALRTNFLVCVNFDNFICSGNDSTITIPSATGIILDKRGSSELTSDCIFSNLIIEGVTGIGISLIATTKCLFIGGTSEGNGNGITVSSSCAENTFNGIDLEDNSTSDVSDGGIRSSYINILSSSSFNITSSARGITVIGGQLNNINIASGVLSTSLIGTSYNANSGSITDNSAAGQTSKIRVFNVGGAVTDQDTYAILPTSISWTPTVSLGSGSGTISTTTARYWVVGPIFYYTVRLQGTAIVLAAGSSQIPQPTGLTASFSKGVGVCSANSNSTGKGFGVGSNGAGNIYTPATTSDTDVQISGWYFLS